MSGRKRPISWSTESRADISAIWEYYAKIAGRYTAEKIIHDIDDACLLLEQFPFAGRSRNEVRQDLRSVPANLHMIFYRVTGGVAEIVRVLDMRRDIDEAFTTE